MSFKKYIKYILIVFLVFLSFLTFKILTNKEIIVLTNNTPIKEKPVNAPEMKDPEITPCVYSLWNENTPCQSTEDLLYDKKEKKGYFTIRYATFDNIKNAEMHVKKLKTLDIINKLKLDIEILKQEKIILVSKGDTLSRLAAINNISVNDLANYNSIENPGKIKLNQKIFVPLKNQYRIISINIQGYKDAKRICEILLSNQFTCLIKSQQ